jgi:Zn-dependent protease with chaperone function
MSFSRPTFRAVLAILLAGHLSACIPTQPSQRVPVPAPDPELQQQARMAVANFTEVVDRVEPVAEAVCRAEAPRLNCDFQILVERDPRAGVNAFQTVSRRGQPLIIFTIGLIAVAENTDELAFVMGHEAAHHIAQHISAQRAQAEVGARVFGELARQSGADARGIGEAAEIGSIVASRRFSQGAELEADALGTIIAFQAGYDPVRGAAFFGRVPDPGGQFLSTHPPNAARIDIVRRTVAGLRRSGT